MPNIFYFQVIVVLLIIFSIGNKAMLVDPNYYVPFLMNLQNYYKTSGIFILYNDNVQNEFEVQILLANFLKRFSVLSIFSQALSYSQITEKSDYYNSINIESLFVTFIDSKKNYDDFSLATLDPDMSYNTWLVIFIGDDINELCYQPLGNPFHLVFNARMIVRCFKDDRIYKWYSLYTNHTEVLELSKWKSCTIQENENYYENRYDLSGKIIRIATPTNSTTKTSAKMYGFLDDLLKELQSFMNFTLKKVIESDAFGDWDPIDKTWSGLIGHLTSGMVDLAVAPIAISKYSLDHIDFSKPLLLSSNKLFLKQPLGARVPWTAYFEAFSMSSWICMLTMFIFSSLLTAYITIIVQRTKFIRISVNYVLENFIRIWGIYCQQGVPVFPSETPLRLAYFSKMLLTLVIWSVYSASITSYLAVLTPSLPFYDINGFVKDGSYKVIVVRNSSDQDFILGDDPVLKNLRPMLKNLDDLPTNPHSAFLQVCNEKVGFYSSDAILRGVSGHIPCSLTYIVTGQFECLALGLAKRSPYLSSINYNIRKLEDNGVLRKLFNWYFRGTDNILPPAHSQIGIWSIVPVLCILGIGIFLSFVVLLIENVIKIFFLKQL